MQLPFLADIIFFMSGMSADRLGIGSVAIVRMYFFVFVQGKHLTRHAKQRILVEMGFCVVVFPPTVASVGSTLFVLKEGHPRQVNSN